MCSSLFLLEGVHELEEVFFATHFAHVFSWRSCSASRNHSSRRGRACNAIPRRSRIAHRDGEGDNGRPRYRRRTSSIPWQNLETPTGPWPPSALMPSWLMPAARQRSRCLSTISRARSRTAEIVDIAPRTSWVVSGRHQPRGASTPRCGKGPSGSSRLFCQLVRPSALRRLSGWAPPTSSSVPLVKQ